MIFDHQSYRSFLKAELLERIQKNESYSLRAFAKALDVSPSALSRVFNGEKGISIERAQDIAQKLKLDEKQTDFLYLLVQFENTKNESLKATLLEKINQIVPNRQAHNLSVDLFKVISDWYNLAILEAIELKKLSHDSAEIAKFFNLSKVEVDLALERLERLELIEIVKVKDKIKSIQRTTNRLLVSSLLPSDGIRKYYKQVMQKAVEAIEEQDIQERIFGTEVFTFDPAQIPELRKRTNDYLNEVLKLSQKSKNQDSVYQASVQIFRLNHRKKGNKK